MPRIARYCSVTSEARAILVGGVSGGARESLLQRYFLTFPHLIILLFRIQYKPLIAEACDYFRNSTPERNSMSGKNS